MLDILKLGFVFLCCAKVSKKSFGSNGNNNFFISFALFWRTLKEGPTPQAIENLIKVCSFAGPATPICIGILMPFSINEFAHSITGSASKQNCVVIARSISERSL